MPIMFTRLLAGIRVGSAYSIMSGFRTRNWMILLITVYLVVPSVRYFPSYPDVVLSWFGFDWYSHKGWLVFLQYALVGIPAFLFIGLTAVLPFALLALLLFRPNSLSRKRELICLLMTLILLSVYLAGWFFFTWPSPYQPVQTFSIIAFALLAFENWREAAGSISPGALAR